MQSYHTTVWILRCIDVRKAQTLMDRLKNVEFIDNCTMVGSGKKSVTRDCVSTPVLSSTSAENTFDNDQVLRVAGHDGALGVVPCAVVVLPDRASFVFGIDEAQSRCWHPQTKKDLSRTPEQ